MRPERSTLGGAPRLVPAAPLAVLLLSVLAGCLDRENRVETPPVETPPVEARAMVDRAVATTGDRILYRIEVEADPTYEVEIPEVGAEIAGFRIVDIGEEEPIESHGRTLYQRWYELRADLVGSYVLPPVAVRYRRGASGNGSADEDRSGDGASEEEPPPDGQQATWQSVETSEIFVEVASVLPADGEAQDIRGLKPLRPVERGIRWAAIAAVALGLAAVAAALARYLRRRSRGEAVRTVPAHEVAFAALDELRRTDFDNPRAVRAFYFAISEVLRAYVEARFRLNATDLTTEEILAGLDGVADLDAEPAGKLRRFLLDTDQVKFAHREPRAAEIESTWEMALGFVESTMPVEEENELEAAA